MIAWSGRGQVLRVRTAVEGIEVGVGNGGTVGMALLVDLRYRDRAVLHPGPALTVEFLERR